MADKVNVLSSVSPSDPRGNHAGGDQGMQEPQGPAEGIGSVPQASPEAASTPSAGQSGSSGVTQALGQAGHAIRKGLGLETHEPPAHEGGS
jgi:hypothetical protein